MEPLSSAVTILQVAELAIKSISALVEYSKDARHASRDRKLLAEEASTSLHVLERLRDKLGRDAGETKIWKARTDVVNHFSVAVNDLAAALNLDLGNGQIKSESRLKKLRTVSMWSFNKDQVYLILARISRIQQHADTLLLDEQL